jgi:hypothetical protein
VAFIGLLWDVLRMEGPPEPHWWIERYVALARDLETDTIYSPRGGAFVAGRAACRRSSPSGCPTPFAAT